MRRRQVAITLVSAIVLGMSSALYFGWHSEPSSHGYRLSQLLATYIRIYQGRLTTPGWQDTRQYVREIGTNGLPQLLRWLGEEQPQWKTNLFGFHEKLPPIFRTKFVHDWLSGEREEFHVKAAKYGFEILGPTAAPSIPDLVRMALDSNHPERAARAVAVLKGIGAEAVPALLRMAADPKAINRFQIFEVLGGMGTNAATAVPVLVELIKSQDIDAANAAMKTLDTLRLSPETVVPALAAYVDHPKLHFLAISSLADYGTEASPAVPRLVQCLTNIDSDIAITAARALARIRSETEIAVPALIGCLKARDKTLRQAAIAALNQYLSPDLAAKRARRENLGELRRERLTYLMANKTEEPASTGPDFSYRRFAKWEDEPSKLFIIKCLTDSSPEVQQEAIIALGRRALDEPSAALPLIDCLDDTPLEIALAAAQTLSERRLQPDLVLPFFIDWLDVPQLRPSAILALAEYGEEARPAVPALRKLLGGPDDKIVRAALEVVDSNASEKALARP